MVILSPFSVSAETDSLTCSQNGYTVLTLNGIFTNKEAASDNKKALEERLSPTYKNENIRVDYLHNPSHLGGLGDILKSVLQGLFDKETINDYDLVEMLKSASEKVKTQKLLLVAHSQGNFYANSFYDTVAGKEGGVPTESIGIYSVATPSGRVAGGGGWLTSDTDKVIAGLLGRTLSRPIMKPNTHIALQPGDDSHGHKFSEVYLKYRSAEIIGGISASLDELQANTVQESAKPCLAPPKLTFGHKIEGAMFAVADPVASAGNTAVVGTAGRIYAAAKTAATLAARISHAGSAAIRALANRPFLNPKGIFGFAGILYGSSVTARDLEDDADVTVSQPNNQNSTPTPTPISTPPIPPPAQTQPLQPSTQENQPTAENTAHVPQTPIPTPVTSRTPASIVSNTLDSRFRGNDSGGSGSSSNPPPPAASAGQGGIGIVEGNTSPTSELTSTSASAAVATPATSSSATTTATTTTPTPTPTPPPPADTTPPDISLTVSSCTSSLASAGCLIATTTITMNWTSLASDFDSYAITCTTNSAACSNFSYASTTATSTTFTGLDNTTYIFSATATDHAGNISAPITKTVSIATRPIVINEIAWAGTSSNRSEDEWVELFNVTDYDIPLTNWVLRSTDNDNTPYIHLTNIIAAKSYFVLERTDNTTISDIIANQIYTGALNNSGEVLELSYASTTIDKTPIACASAWCGYGSASPNYISMERYDPYSSGDNQSNWGSWAGFGASSKNADNAAIHGTPGRRNSLNYLINKGSVTIGANTTLKKSESPYVITATNLSVSSGVTVDVEAGTVIKFLGSNYITINGIMKTHGTATEPVVFTSINDDTYGGDVNGDGTTTPAAAGDWSTIQPTTSGSIFDYAIIRYGGKIDQFYGSVQAQLQASNVSITITNSTSEFSKTNGLYFSNVSGEISSSTLRDNGTSSGYAGTQVSGGGGVAIKNNLFQRNSIGLSIGGGSSQTTVVSNNSFLDNDESAISFGGGKVLFSASSASGNGLDAILTTPSVIGGITFVPDLPYVFDANTTRAVSSGATMTISPGAILKFKSAAALYIDGSLDAQGTAALPIVLTSFHDDDCGIAAGCGDTNKATTSAAAGDWGGLIFRSKGATASTLDHAIVRYGGNKNTLIDDRGAVAVQNGTSTVVISNSTIEKSFFAGIAAIGSGTASTTITSSIIRDNLISFGSATAGYGVWTSAGANPTISNTSFSNNGTHIATSSATWTDGGGNVGE